jgi:hypothetical protein
MKSAKMVEVWKGYAVRLLKASNCLISTVRALNLNNKHRVVFRIDNGDIMFGDTLILQTKAVIYNKYAEAFWMGSYGTPEAFKTRAEARARICADEKEYDEAEAFVMEVPA